MSDKKVKLSLVCYGNILRSQVLEQYLRYFSADGLELFSAGISGSGEFADKDSLFEDVGRELDKREIPYNLSRNCWDDEAVCRILGSTFVLCADSSIRDAVLKRLGKNCDKAKVTTFYKFIGEGEKDFEDTYDYEKKRQDPVKFASAFDEIERIAKKILLVLDIPL